MRGATKKAKGLDLQAYISIHAPHAGRDNSPFHRLSNKNAFQSTRPMRGATQFDSTHSAPL